MTIQFVKERVCFFLVILLLPVSYVACFNHLEPTEVGVARNFISGNMVLQNGGWHITPPWVLVATIDTRPIRVSVPSAGHGYSSKLVQFDSNYWEDFVQVEGWRYYWWENRLSYNFGYDEEHRGLKDILRGHAYGTKKYPFIKILEEYKEE